MIRTRPFLHSFLGFVFLVLLMPSRQLSARTPSSQGAAGNQGETDDQLYRELCELNGNWAMHTPAFKILDNACLAASEASLIGTHLQLVIRLLQSAKVGHLSDAQRANRLTHLQNLQAYLKKGDFPINSLASGRRPVFIDPWGAHCAVGYLIVTSGHARLADAINREHQLDLIRDIKTAGLANWQRASGFSLEELALIQPTYRSTTLKYPAEIEELILGNSGAIRADVQSGKLSVNARCAGKTLLHFAAAAGDLTLVKLLVEKGAEIRSVSQPGCDKRELAKGGNQTVVTVRWNQSTSVTNRGGIGLGMRGAVLQAERGRFIAGVLNDLRGGNVGLNAFDYATEDPRPSGRYSTRHPRSFRPGGVVQKRSENDEIVSLKENRAAVATWLEEQGLQID